MESVLLIPNISKKKAISLAQQAEKILKKAGKNVFFDKPELAESLGGDFLSPERAVSETDLVLIFGGDGTFLNAARRFAGSNVPLLGINLGTLGFLTEVDIDHLRNALKNLIEGNFTVEKRMMLGTEVLRKGKKVHSGVALNDIVVGKGAFSRIIKLRIKINGEFFNEFGGDGLIVATPTGSTAYSLSAGGPMVHPALENIIITPICPHSLNSRSLVISSQDLIEVTILSTHKEIRLTVDGQTGWELQDGDTVRVKMALDKTNLIKLPGFSYYKILRSRLNVEHP